MQGLLPGRDWLLDWGVWKGVGAVERGRWAVRLFFVDCEAGGYLVCSCVG
jgi:hypothetical protein